MEPVQVLRHPAVTGLGEPEIAFQDQERMLHLGPHRRLAGLHLPVRPGHRLQHPFTGRDPPLDRRQVPVSHNVGSPLHTLVAGIGIHDLIIGTHQVGDLFEVVPGGSDLKIELATKVKMRDGLRFFTAPAQINPGRN